MIRRSREPQFVPPHMCCDMLGERRDLAVAPVFMQDVELQRVALNFEIVERRHRVRVIASAANHTAQLTSDLPDNEVLLRRADAVAEPHAHYVLVRQIRFPWAGLDISRTRRANAS